MYKVQFLSKFHFCYLYCLNEYNSLAKQFVIIGQNIEFLQSLIAKFKNKKQTKTFDTTYNINYTTFTTL